MNDKVITGRLILARRLAAHDARAHGALELAESFLDGKCDDSISIRVATAAIIETTELAARLVEKRSIDLKARAIDTIRTATAIRSGAHLKGSSDGR